jgi:uncharacterized protein (DUF983 family)
VVEAATETRVTEDYYPTPSVLRTGLRCRCPRCAEGRLFRGLLKVVARCSVCGVDLSEHDSADGPAVFVVLIVGAIVVGIALILKILFDPPIWLHMVLEFPLVVVLSLGLLRPFKATFVAIQYRTKAREYRAE